MERDTHVGCDQTRGERFEWYTQVGSEASLEEMLQEVLTDVPARVLDLGCGTSQCVVLVSYCLRRDGTQV